MFEQDEKRARRRRDADCNMIYKYPEATREYPANCINLSGTGILFKAQNDVEAGRALEIRIMPENFSCPSMTAFIEVIRSNPTGDDQFEIAGSIRAIKAN